MEAREQVKSIIKKTQALLCMLEKLGDEIAENPHTYGDMVYKVAIQSEYLQRGIRRLTIKDSGVVALAEQENNYMLEAADALGITVEESCDVVTITIPGLMAKRKHENIGFISKSLFARLHQFTHTREARERFTKCTVHITFVYDKSHGIKGRIRDYDNLELKLILDIVTFFFMEDDTGFLCKYIYSSELGDTDKTVISITNNTP
jgi:hypothetical protein